jgi:hypothetical protein
MQGDFYKKPIREEYENKKSPARLRQALINQELTDSRSHDRNRACK